MVACLLRRRIGPGNPNPTTLTVRLNLLDPDPVCSATIAPLVFPNQDAGASVAFAATLTTFDITLTWDKAGTTTLAFDGGSNPSGSVRQVTHAGGDAHDYRLRDPSGTLLFVGGYATMAVMNGTTVATFDEYLATGTLPSTPGAYSDGVTVTFSF